MVRVPWERLAENSALSESVVTLLVLRLRKRAQAVDGSGGDGGRDLFEYTENGELVLYEAKSFTGRMNAGRRSQVRRSLISAARHQPDHWDLLVPIDPNPAEQRWFDSLRVKFPFVRHWRGRSWLDNKFAAHPDLVRYALQDAPEYLLERIAEAGVGQSGLADGIGDYLRWTGAPQTPGDGRRLRCGLVPDVSSAFVERESQEALARALRREDGDGPERGVAVPVKGRVITGTGGAGKTSLAAWYCHDAVSDAARGVDVLLWVTAHGASDVADAYAQAAGMLAVAPRGDDTAVMARQFLNWLRTTECRWLIVLDDVYSPGVLEGLWPPQHTAGDGRVILTTRSRERDLVVLSGHAFLQVGVFTPAESLAYLRSALQRPADAGSDSVAALAGLAEDLGHLPLALSRAAAYLDYNVSCSVARYRRLLADRRLTLERLIPAVRGGAAGSSVAALWDISIDQADQHTGNLARPMLELAAVVDGAAGVPEEFFLSEAACAWLVERGEAGRQVGELEAELTLATLDRLHLIDRVVQGSSHVTWWVQVHQLIQRAVREHRVPGSEGEAWQQRAPAVLPAAARALLEIWTDPEDDQDMAQRLRASAGSLADLDQGTDSNPLWSDESAYAVLFRLGNSAGESGSTAWARDHFEALVPRAIGYLGADHSSTLVARVMLGRWQSKSADFAEAVATLEGVEADYRRVYGSGALETLSARHELAVVRGDAGDAPGAVTALADVLAGRRRAGAGRRVILTTQHNLAYWNGVAGNAAEAVVAYRELLPAMEEEFGGDHQGTLMARHNLARWIGETGDAAQAVELLEALVRVQTAALGPRHPDVMTSRQSLGRWQAAAGDTDQAVAGYRGLIRDMRDVFEGDPLELLAARHNLARLQAGTDPVAAVAELEAVAADRTRILGPRHPDTLVSCYSLALCLGEAGRPCDAVLVLELLLQDQVHVFGEDHAGVLETRHSLAVMCGEAGDPHEAIAGLRGLRPDLERVLGPGHLSTVKVIEDLGDWCAAAGDMRAAIEAYGDLIARIERYLGAEHLGVLPVLDKFAMWQGRAGRPEEAVRVLARMLSIAQRILGGNDPHISVIEGNLAFWRAQVRGLGDAETAAGP
ncbi:tetratricopeptide repeat protein [Streptomyces sp. NPDC088747]|uniref:tetratricopeptide repeat protein n=1 Tax=Streptomyces sp. NPDC088747 TaxID=3365886 RepID=UPI00380E04C0